MIGLNHGGKRKSAKILSDVNIDDLLLYAETTRQSARNRIMVLLSAKAGRREIARLTWTATAARDRMGGRWRLGDRFAGSAGELLADVLDHLPLPRNELQCLGHVLTNLAQSANTTTWADCRGGRFSKNGSFLAVNQSPRLPHAAFTFLRRIQRLALFPPI